MQLEVHHRSDLLITESTKSHLVASLGINDNGLKVSTSH